MAFQENGESGAIGVAVPAEVEREPKQKIRDAIRMFAGSPRDIEDLNVLLDSGELAYIEDRLAEPDISLSIEKSSNPNEFDFYVTDKNGIERRAYTHRPTQRHPRE